jgi:hypothetical protein
MPDDSDLTEFEILEDEISNSDELNLENEEVIEPAVSEIDEDPDLALDKILKSADIVQEQTVETKTDDKIEIIEEKPNVSIDNKQDENKRIHSFLQKMVTEYFYKSATIVQNSDDVVKTIENLLLISNFLNHMLRINTNETAKKIYEEEKLIVDDVLYQHNALNVYYELKDAYFKEENKLLLRHKIKDKLSRIIPIILKYQAVMPEKKALKHYRNVAGWGAGKAEQFEEEELENVRRIGDAKKYLVDSSGEITPAEEGL